MNTTKNNRDRIGKKDVKKISGVEWYQCRYKKYTTRLQDILSLVLFITINYDEYVCCNLSSH